MSCLPKMRLIAVGRVKKAWIQAGIALYQKRLPEVEITEIKDSAPPKEGQLIIASLKPQDRLVALTEAGKSFSSIEFAAFLSRADSNSLVFAIGSADGLSADAKQAATQQLSLSPMTFPHEIARLLLLEQLYRAKTILQGSRYHK